MSKNNKRSQFSNQIYFKVDAKQVTLIPGQVIYVAEPKEETKEKMHSEKWSTQIAKDRHYMFICSDGRFATVLPLSSKPPKNPFQVQFVDHLRSGLTLTVRCDQKCKLPLTRLVEGKYSNFKGVAYTFDKYTTMKLIGYSIMYELHQWYTPDDGKSMIDMAWGDLDIMINSFKGSFNNMDYDFKHGPQAGYDYDEVEEECIDESMIDSDDEDESTSDDSISFLKNQIEELKNKLENLSTPVTDTVPIANESETSDEVNDFTETMNEIIAEEESKVEGPKEEEKPVPESKVEEIETPKTDDQDSSDAMTFIDSNDPTKTISVDEETADLIYNRQTAINTYSLMDNIKAIREVRGLKVEPVVPKPVPTETANVVPVTSEEDVKSILDDVTEFLKPMPTVAEGSHLNSDFGIIDTLKFPQNAPLSAKGNSINAFIKGECTQTKTEYTSLRVLFTAYKKYCQSTGLWCASLGDLKCYLILNGYKVERLMIDQKDRPLDAVNIVLKAQLKLIEQSKKDNNLIDYQELIDYHEEEKPVPKESKVNDDPKINFKGSKVEWNPELLEYAQKLVSTDPNKAVEIFRYKNIKSLKATIAKYKKMSTKSN